MATSTHIHPDKVQAYLATDYTLGHDGQRIVLNIGKPSTPLAALMAAHGVHCGAFLTAYNPRGTIQSDTANQSGHAELARLLRDQSHPFVEGSGSATDSDWPAEKGYFALGLALDAAKAIGRQFDQDAIVWTDADALPQLILLR